MTAEDDMTYDELRARMAEGIPAQIVPGPRPTVVHESDYWQALADVWGDETREWAEGVTHEDPGSDA